MVEKYFHFILAVVFCLSLNSCAVREKVQSAPGLSEQAEAGERIEGGFSYTATEAGKILFQIDGEKVAGLAGASVQIEKPEVKWYLDSGVVNITAEEGVFVKDTEQISFSQNVFVSSDSGKMKCEKLDWDASMKKMTARGNVNGEFNLR